ncbi:MAG: bifunctional homocysteine S-methyltransferase/methylenetetrahydrofolate reductase [Chloroflexi bacterium]|nr:MAG: bifunctional homocysteine S-methyltransferase/methylenetetrahydrofolate reductase [Chloroflexota bacterium]
MDRFTARLEERGALLFDGAMGTELWARGVPPDHCLEEVNVSDPSLVRAIHRDYIAAGADVIETNTFGANRFRLAEHYLEGRGREILEQGAKLAVEARNMSGRPVLVAGSVGPLGKPLEPIGAIKLSAAERIYGEIVESLAESGVDLLIFETFTSVGELELAVRVAREAAHQLPVVACMSLDDDADVGILRAVSGLGPAALGFNCGSGPQAALQIARRLHEAGLGPIAVIPNAGLPQRVSGRLVYAAGPRYFAESVEPLLQAGARVLGGCCGTRPEHISAMRAALDASRNAGDSIAPAVRVRRPKPESESNPPASRLAASLSRGDFVISVELTPPRGVDPKRMLDGARLLKEAGVDYANVTDSAMARVRMGVITCSALVQQQVGLEAIAHFTTRDRNVMAIQSELIGAHALGIRNILCLRGDPPKAGDNAVGIWEVNSVGLINIVANLNRGLDANASPLGQPASFLIGAAVNPNARDIRREIGLLDRKVKAGAGFVVTQPIYELDAFERFLEAAGDLPIPLLVGVLPLISGRHAEYLDNEVPGITVPDAIKERIRAAGEQAAEVGVEIAVEFLDAARRWVRGAYVIPSHGRYDLAAVIVQRAREMVG